MKSLVSGFRCVIKPHQSNPQNPSVSPPLRKGTKEKERGGGGNVILAFQTQNENKNKTPKKKKTG